jgi:hypothetical protein
MDPNDKPMQLRVFLSLVRLMRSVPLLHSGIWKARRGYNAIKRTLIVRRPVVAADSHLASAISEKIPYAAGKLGSIEAAALSAYMVRAAARSRDRYPREYPGYVFHTLHLNAGVFPQDADVYDRFSEIFLTALADCDLLVAWDIAGEAEVLSRYCPNATLVSALEPFFSAQPWSAALRDRRVLVISPFANSIRKQYEVRDALWDNKDILPRFCLRTVRAPLSAALVSPVDTNWSAALERMQGEMDAIDYDVALIGAGAFSIPLAVHAKGRGKVGIHMGGSLQILFGIYGARWEKKPAFKSIIKPNWIRPARDETPADAGKVEDACYW